MSEEMSNEVQDALNSMNEEIAQPDVYGQCTSSTTELQSSENKEANEVSASQPVVSIKKQLKIFEEINMQMGRFCQALKVVDAQFEQQAQVFYKAAEELGKKEKLSDEESIEFAVNIAAWATVKVFGKIYANLQKSKQLSEVKKILKQEADARLDSVKQLKKWMPGILDSAYDRYNHVSDFEAITRCVSNLRESEYMNAVVLFLEATYEAALQDKFQDAYAYPSFAPVNRHILYGILCGKPELAYDDYLEGRRNCIEGLISQTENEINGKAQLSKEAFVFASDSQVMAIAIHDINPLTDSYEVIMDENTDEDRLLCQNYYERFVGLYEEADSHSENEIARAALNNESLVETVIHYNAIDKTFKEHEALCRYQLCIIGLSGVLGFLSPWLTLGWEWYWSLLIGVIVGALVYWMMPINKGLNKVNDKLIRIEKSIQGSNRSKGGDVKMADLAYMDSQTKSPWIGAVIGAILGLPFILFAGPLWGAAIGFIAVLVFGGSEEDEEADYSYEHIKVAPSWFLRCVLYLLIASCIWVVVDFFIVKYKSKHTTEEVVAEVVAAPGEAYNNIDDKVVIAVAASTENDAIRDLYKIFYGIDNPPYITYSNSIKEIFKELGITSAIEDPYTPSFKSEIDRMDAIQDKVGDPSFGFDEDILFGGQGDVDNLNLIVTDVNTIKDDYVEIKAIYNNNGQYDRVFKMQKINGIFKIDDMDNIRSFIMEECNKARQYLKERDNEAVSDNHKYEFSGKIGKSPIVLEIVVNGSDITGKYAYQSTLKKYGDKPENYFYLSGKFDELGDISLVSKMHNTEKPFEYITLPSKEFNHDSVITGELKNANTGHTYIIELHME